MPPQAAIAIFAAANDASSAYRELSMTQRDFSRSRHASRPRWPTATGSPRPAAASRCCAAACGVVKLKLDPATVARRARCFCRSFAAPPSDSPRFGDASTGATPFNSLADLHPAQGSADKLPASRGADESLVVMRQSASRSSLTSIPDHDSRAVSSPSHPPVAHRFSVQEYCTSSIRCMRRGARSCKPC